MEDETTIPPRAGSLGGITVRPAVPDDVEGMAEVHVRSWQETYRGTIDDTVLDDPNRPAARRAMWEKVLADVEAETPTGRVCAVAELDGAGQDHAGDDGSGSRVVGIALSGPPRDEDATWERQLYVLYLLEAHQGSGAGEALLRAVLPPQTSAALWVLDPNPRAQAFYRRHGFLDEQRKTVDGLPELRMIRT